jgi:hypothetical protein
MSTPTLLSRAQALLARSAARAILPLALAATTADAQVVLTSVEAGFIDVSGERFVFGTSTNTAGDFTSPGIFDLTSTVGPGGFALSGDLLFDGTQNTLGSGEDINFSAYVRYFILAGTWDNHTSNEPLLLTFTGTSVFPGTIEPLFFFYTDQSYANATSPASVVSGANYDITMEASQALFPGPRGAFSIELRYLWTPVPVGAASLLDTTFTLGAVITPIPEPASYAALLGACALLRVAATRRPRRAAR